MANVAAQMAASPILVGHDSPEPILKKKRKQSVADLPRAAITKNRGMSVKRSLEN